MRGRYEIGEPRSSARRTCRGSGQRVLRARRTRTRPMWPNARTGLGVGRIGKGVHTATCGTARCSCSPSCAPSSTSSAGSGTRSLSAFPSGRGRVQFQCVAAW